MQIGDKFPTINVQTTRGDITLPDDYQGKWFIIFSHPADFTPVCTTEFVSFAQNQEKFAKQNTELIGLSVDQISAHLKWLEWIEDHLNVEIKFPVIADSLGTVSKKLGMLTANNADLVRNVLVVDPEGIIRLILVYPKAVG